MTLQELVAKMRHSAKRDRDTAKLVDISYDAKVAFLAKANESEYWADLIQNEFLGVDAKQTKV